MDDLIYSPQVSLEGDSIVISLSDSWLSNMFSVTQLTSGEPELGPRLADSQVLLFNHLPE